MMVRRSPLRPGLFWWVAAMPFLLFLVIPLVALLLGSTPAEFTAALRRTDVQQALTLSLRTSLISTFLAVVFGTPLAILISRGRVPLRRLVDAMIDLPIVLPPAVAGIGLLMAFGRNGLVGRSLDAFGLQIPFTEIAVVFAQLFVAAPLYVRAAIIGLSQVDEELEAAALIDGGTTWQVLRYVSLPLTGPALLAGAVMTWARAIGEFGATIIFAGNLAGRTQTMPLAIYLGFEMDLTLALTLSLILIGCSTGVLVLIRRTSSTPYFRPPP